MFDFRQLLGIKDLSTLLNEFFDRFKSKGGKVTNLNPGGVFRSMSESAITPVSELNDLLVQVLPQGFATYATGQWLDLKVADVGITRLQATRTQGQIPVYKQDPSSPLLYPAGAVVKTEIGQDGQSLRYFVTSDTIIDAGLAQGLIPIEAEFPGSQYNVGEGYITVMETYIPGVDHISNEADWILTEGTDIESDDNLRQRYFLKWDELAQGGIDESYISWAKSITGVVDVSVDSDFPRGQGTVDVIITSAEGMPSAQLIQDVQDYIEQKKPNIANVLVKSPATVPVDVTAIIYIPKDSGDINLTQSTGESRIQAYYGQNTVTDIKTRRIGESTFLSRLNSLLMAAPDAVNAQISSPAADVIVQPDELTILNSLNISVERLA